MSFSSNGLSNAFKTGGTELGHIVEDSATGAAQDELKSGFKQAFEGLFGHDAGSGGGISSFLKKLGGGESEGGEETGGEPSAPSTGGQAGVSTGTGIQVNTDGFQQQNYNSAITAWEGTNSGAVSSFESAINQGKFADAQSDLQGALGNGEISQSQYEALNAGLPNPDSTPNGGATGPLVQGQSTPSAASPASAPASSSAPAAAAPAAGATPNTGNVTVGTVMNSAGQMLQSLGELEQMVQQMTGAGGGAAAGAAPSAPAASSGAAAAPSTGGQAGVSTGTGIQVNTDGFQQQNYNSAITAWEGTNSGAVSSFESAINQGKFADAQSDLQGALGNGEISQSQYEALNAGLPNPDSTPNGGATGPLVQGQSTPSAAPAADTPEAAATTNTGNVTIGTVMGNAAETAQLLGQLQQMLGQMTGGGAASAPAAAPASAPAAAPAAQSGGNADMSTLLQSLNEMLQLLSGLQQMVSGGGASGTTASPAAAPQASVPVWAQGVTPMSQSGVQQVSSIANSFFATDTSATSQI